MFENPTVIAAIVAGIVSLIISGFSGIYSLAKSRKKFEELRKELLVKASVSNFLEKKESFLDEYRKFEHKLYIIKYDNPNDGTKAVQFIIDFYAANARDFYLRNKSILETRYLNEQLERITTTINSGNLNNPENQSVKREFGQNILSFLSELNNQILRIN
ncbi:MAG: hypothetical protein WD048_00985 [Chitinophagales bacterium]